MNNLEIEDNNTLIHALYQSLLLQKNAEDKYYIFQNLDSLVFHKRGS